VELPVDPQNPFPAQKSQAAAYPISVFLGCLGIDRCYLGYVGWGVLKLLRT
jgi:TM2 domain-containing membrane protein YozV